MIMQTKTKLAVISSAVAFITTAVFAQEKQYTRADYEQAIKVTDEVIAGQKDRIQTVTDKLKATDEMIERRVARVMNQLCSVADSTDSGTKVIQAKEDILMGLKKTLDYYVRERDQRFAALYRRETRISKEELLIDIDRLNARIEKRVDQILAITRSLPGEVGGRKSQVTTYWDGAASRVDPEASRARMAANRAALIREKVEKGLEDSIRKLENTNRTIQSNLQTFVYSDAGKKLGDQFIKQNLELAEKRRYAMARVASDRPVPSNRLGSKAAQALADQVQQERIDARTDITEWLRLKSARDVERERLYTYERRVASYKAALQKM